MAPLTSITNCFDWGEEQTKAFGTVLRINTIDYIDINHFRVFFALRDGALHASSPSGGTVQQHHETVMLF